MTRDVVKCPSCSLVQFVTATGGCRRCGQQLAPSSALGAPAVLPAVAESSASLAVTALPREPFALVVQVGRSARGMNRKQLAKRAGISFQQVYRLEQYGHDPHFHTVRRVARALGVRPSFLAHMTAVVAELNERSGQRLMKNHAG